MHEIAPRSRDAAFWEVSVTFEKLTAFLGNSFA